MAEKIETGHYRVGQTFDESDQKMTIGVVKGEFLNEDEDMFDNFVGMKKTKWYVYQSEQLTVSSSDSPRRELVDDVNLLDYFDSRDEAVEFGESLL